MLVALWVVNAVLALVFAAAGLMKLVRSKDALAQAGMGWTADTPAAAVKAVGAIEVVGAAGLILPLATGIAPALAAAAATGLALVMVGAVVVHARRDEGFVVPVVLLLASITSAALAFLSL